VFAGLCFDLMVCNQSGILEIPVENILEGLIVILALIFYQDIHKYGIAILIPILAITNILMLILYDLAIHRIYNSFLGNLYYIIVAPLYYLLFLKMLNLKRRYKMWFFCIAALSMIFLVYEYATINHATLSSTIIIVFHLQHLILCCLVFYKIIHDENNRLPLSKHPFFWLCAAIIISAVVEIPYFGMHSFLVKNYIELYESYWMILIVPVSSIIISVCNCMAICLCRVSQHRALGKLV